MFHSVKSSESVDITSGTETVVLTLPVTIETNDQVEINSISSMNFIIGPSNSNQYSIAYRLYRNGNLLSQVPIEKKVDKSLGKILLDTEISKLTSKDMPPIGSHHYEVSITVISGDIILATCNNSTLTVRHF